MKNYFVVYFYKCKRKGFGVGNVFIELNQPIEQENAIREVERTIKYKNKFEACAVLNFFEVGETVG